MFMQTYFTVFVGQIILILVSLVLFKTFTSFSGKLRIFPRLNVKIGRGGGLGSL